MLKCRQCFKELINLPDTKDKGMTSLCAECRVVYKIEQSENKKRYYKEVIIDRRHKKHPPRIKDPAKNKEKKRLREATRRQNNLEETRQYHREWRKRNKEKHAEYQRKYLTSNENIRFGSRLRTLVYVALKTQSASKVCSTEDLVGCSIEQLQFQLESKFQPGM